MTLTLDSSIVQCNEKFYKDKLNGPNFIYVQLHETQVPLPCPKIVVIILSILIFDFDDLGLKKKCEKDYTLISFVNQGLYFAETNVNHGWHRAESHFSKICRISW